jgi:hypothetical protein
VTVKIARMPCSARSFLSVGSIAIETGESLHDLVASLDGQVPGLSRYISPADLVLPAAAFLQDRRPTQRELVFMDFNRLIEDWPLIARGATQMVEFLEQERIPDAARLPTEVVLAPLVALWAHAPEHPDKLGYVRTLLFALPLARLRHQPIRVGCRNL